MKKYKVIKDFYPALKGDVFEYDENIGLYFLTINKDDKSFIAFSEDYMDAIVSKGYLMSIDTNSDSKEIITNTVKYIDSLLEQYDSDLRTTQEKAERGEVQPCVKLEAETVYFNLSKVLNAVRNKLTE